MLVGNLERKGFVVVDSQKDSVDLVGQVDLEEDALDSEGSQVLRRVQVVVH